MNLRGAGSTVNATVTFALQDKRSLFPVIGIEVVVAIVGSSDGEIEGQRLGRPAGRTGSKPMFRWRVRQTLFFPENGAELMDARVHHGVLFRLRLLRYPRV